MNKIQMVIKRVYENHHPQLSDIEFLLGLKDYDDIASILDFADNVRRQYCGEGVIVRAIVEFSSFCRNTCMYCGLNRNNTFLKRYRLSEEEILKAIKAIYDTNIKTVVLQSGEDEYLDPVWFANVISRIKNSFDIAITLSVGQRTADEYKLWKNAGADRYLLKIETSNKALYNSLHPEMSFDERVYCSRIIGSIGYQNGSGCLVGLKNQTTTMLAEDILFFKREDFDMIGIGLFIPHENTFALNAAL